MRRSENNNGWHAHVFVGLFAGPGHAHEDVGMPPERRSIDWRGWVILAWVVWFGLLYGTMVVEQRGQKISDRHGFWGLPLARRATANSGL